MFTPSPHLCLLGLEEGGRGEGEPPTIVLEGVTGKEWVTFFRGFQSFYIKSNFDKNFNIMGVH